MKFNMGVGDVGLWNILGERDNIEKSVNNDIVYDLIYVICD